MEKITNSLLGIRKFIEGVISMELGKVLKIIDRAIRNTWLDKISKDHKSFYLLKEDTLKNALYYHLRTELASLLE
jgi:hypothetical protein